MSREGSGAQPASPPGPPSPTQQHRQQPLPDHINIPPSYGDAVTGPYADADANADSSFRATRSSLPSQEQIQFDEYNVDATKGSESSSCSNKPSEGAWKNEWVISLIHLRGSLDMEFRKAQKFGSDLWTRVCAGMVDAHVDFDKSSESCRKEWQRVYVIFKDAKLGITSNTKELHMPSEWFDLIQSYMHCHFDANGSATGSDEPAILHEAANVNTATDDDLFVDHIQMSAKRARRDQEIKDTLAKMVVTWRESLEVLKDSEAKRLQILQKMSTIMAGLLDTLKK